MPIIPQTLTAANPRIVTRGAPKRGTMALKAVNAASPQIYPLIVGRRYHRQIPISRSLTLIVLIALLLFPGLTPCARADSGVSGWRQSNTSGFGIPENTAVSSLDVFGGYLYAGTWNDNGAHVWRTTDGQVWRQFTPPWTETNVAVNDMASFGSYLYVCTGNEGGGKIWCTDGYILGTGGFGGAGTRTVASIRPPLRSATAFGDVRFNLLAARHASI